MQVKKDKIREQVLTAALSRFCTHGFANTSIAEIAKHAGISTGNVYRYFSSKDELLSAVVPGEFIETFTNRLQELMRLAAGEQDLGEGPGQTNSRYWQSLDSLMHLSYAHRERVLILLSQESASPHEGFRARLIEIMVTQANWFAHQTVKDQSFTSSQKYILHLIYSSFVENLTQILRHSGSEREMKEHLFHLRQYHLPGLQSFFTGASYAQKSGGSYERT